MNIDLWVYNSDFRLLLPLRPSGYILFAITILGTALALRSRGWKPGFALRDSPTRTWVLRAVILGLIPLTTGLLWVRFSFYGSSSPGLGVDPGRPLLIFFGALPWMLAAGTLGVGEAAMVGLLSGFVRAGWGTHSALTPLIVSFQALCVAWLVRRDYDDWLGTAIRNPILSALAGGALFSLLRSLDRLLYSRGTIYDGLDYVLTLLGPTLLAAALEAVISGVLAQALRQGVPGLWFSPQRLSPPPYRRSLAARLITVYVALGALASGVLLYGDWILAYASARESVEREIRTTAVQVGEDIPYFIQTGRSMARQFGSSVGLDFENLQGVQEELERQLRFAPFFARLRAYDQEGDLIAVAPEGSGGEELVRQQEVEALDLALRGIPQEVVSPGGGEDTELIFFTPIFPTGGDSPLGVLAAETEIGSNPVLAPVLRRLAGVSQGTALILGEHGEVIYEVGGERTSPPEDLGALVAGEIVTYSSPAGTRSLVYIYPVPSYPWQVVVTLPLRVVNSLAVPIAVRLFVVMMVVGAGLLLAVYLTSRQLTRPLRQMARVAESMARGDLASPVDPTGDDEIGRLSSSFERMRRSLRDRLDEMALVLRVSQSLASSFKLADVLPPILSGVREITQADLVRLVLLPPGDVRGREAEAYSAGEDPGGWEALDHQVLELCGQNGGFILENPRRARSVLDLGQLTTPLETLMGIPVSTEGEYVGALWIGHLTPHDYNPDERNLLSIVASQLGVSLSNARLYQMAEQERALLSAILEATPEAVIVIDEQARIVLANPAAEIVLPGESRQAWGKPVEEVVEHAALKQLLLDRGYEVQGAEVRLSEDKVLFGTAQDIAADPGGRPRRVCVLWDITHFKKLDALKSEFVATVSHDLKTPLTMMRGYGAMLPMVGSMSGQQKELVTKIVSSVDRMARLVDDLLDLGRIEAGIALEVEQIDLAEMLPQILQDYRPQAESKHIDLHLDLDQSPQLLDADGALLRQAITNLVDNAVRFHPSRGQVVVKAFQDIGRQYIQVRDDGPGIAAADQARLFEKFYKVRAEDGSTRGGTGLGLAIVKSIIERHQGQIHLESQLGVGSTFTIELPLQQGEAGEAGPPLEPSID